MKGPDIFDTMILIGQEEVLNRLNAAFNVFDDIIEGNRIS
jgi:hypothetical protein